jgi:hypothetical protein
MVHIANSPKLVNLPTWQKVGKTVGTIGRGIAITSGIQNITPAAQAIKQAATINPDGSWGGKDLTMDQVHSIFDVAFGARMAGIGLKSYVGKKYGFEEVNPKPKRVEAQINNTPVTVEDPDIVSKLHNSQAN